MNNEHNIMCFDFAGFVSVPDPPKNNYSTMFTLPVDDDAGVSASGWGSEENKPLHLYFVSFHSLNVNDKFEIG